MLKPNILGLATIAALYTGSGVAGLNEGIAAYKTGEYKTALGEFQPLAEQGDSTAQYHLGRMYRIGQGVTQDYKQAAAWYLKAADRETLFSKAPDLENPKAQLELASLYKQGLGVEKDRQRTVKFLVKAAAAGNAKAQARLGDIFLEGIGPKDYQIGNYETKAYAFAAYGLYQLAANNGEAAGEEGRLFVMRKADIGESWGGNQDNMRSMEGLEFAQALAQKGKFKAALNDFMARYRIGFPKPYQETQAWQQYQAKKGK